MGDVKEQHSHDLFRTPWGWVGAVYTRRGLRRLTLPLACREAAAAAIGLPAGEPPVPWEGLRRAVRDYLGGGSPAVDVPIDLTTAAGFTERVRRAARAVPPGSTVTYGELARRAGSPRAARAAGQVMARNPLPLVIACHRVVAAGGAGGFAGGAAMKARLLALESRTPPPPGRRGAVGGRPKPPAQGRGRGRG